MKTNSNVRQRMVAIGLVLITVVGLGVGVGASGAFQDDGDGQVRIAHLSPDAPAVDVLVDGEPVLEGAEYGDVGDYTNLSAGEHDVTIQTSENESVVFEGNVTVESDTQYTVAAIGEVSEETFDVAVYEDDFETPEEGDSSVRLVHASPDAPAVDVTVAESGDTLFDNASFGNATDYETVPAGEYTLEIRPASEDDTEDPVTTVDVTLENETVYSAIAAGYLSPDEAAADQPFEVLLVTDSGAEMVDEETTEEMDEEETDEEETTEEMDEETETTTEA
ncbi:DUF4397 domain-containing protein [Halorussus salilacus]|uniref:DUF4397 domain-containing protein n=1 Tax=Halorussus salilacus TaxID=2953750 RepID=UPI0020A1583B|nr:DUF4397 domain-containing protein [Halorussus salilacus]USZ68419.1 DUF4397 domain-containing protein [Halorussus salilacus]